jgi:hypothetical protein
MIWGLLGVVAFALGPIVCVWCLVRGLRSGIMPARGASYSRDTQPVNFWLLAALYCAVPTFFLAIAAKIGLDIASGR